MYVSMDVIYPWTVNREMGFPRSACRGSLSGARLTPARGTSAALLSFVLTYGECMNAGESPATAVYKRFTLLLDVLTRKHEDTANQPISAFGFCSLPFNINKMCYKKIQSKDNWEWTFRFLFLEQPVILYSAFSNTPLYHTNKKMFWNKMYFN